MMKRSLPLCLSAVLSCGIVAGARAANVPEIFAPGVISGPAGEDCPAFAPDGNTVFFDRSSGQDVIILVSHKVDGVWSTPQIAPFSGQWLDHDPVMSPDGSFLVFTSNRPDTPSGKMLSVVRPDGSVSGAGHLWRVDRERDGWGKPVRLPDAVNASMRTYAPSIAADGSVYFIRPDQAGTFHIYRSLYRNGAYQTAEQVALGDPAAQTHDPAIAPDQSFIVFNSNDAKASAMGDLYIAFRDSDGWGKPIDLGETINGRGGKWSQWGAHLSPDHRTLYYTSDRTTQPTYPRTPAQAQQQLEQMQSWDNGADNIWSVSLAPWLDEPHTAHSE